MRLLVFIVCGWALGILCENAALIAIPFWIGGLVLPGLVACVGLWRRWRLIWVLASVLLGAFAAGGLASAVERARAMHVEFPVDEHVVLEGVVARPCATRDGWRSATIYVDSWIASGRVRGVMLRLLVHDEGGRELLPGDRVRFAGIVRAPRGYGNEGAFNRWRYLVGRRIDGTLVAEPPGLVRVDSPSRAKLWRRAAILQEEMLANYLDAPDGDGRALISALVFGRRSEVRPALEAAFRRSGVAHVLSVSGLHLVAVTCLFYALAHRLWLASGTLAFRWPAERAASLAAIPVAIAYTMITGGEVATVRALVCALVVLVGRILGRRADGQSALATAALFLLVLAPWSLFEASFQLSFAAALALIMVASSSWVRTARADASWWFRVPVKLWRMVVASVVASVATFLATAPFSALHFGVLQPQGIIANLVVVPLAEVVILPLGLLGALFRPFGAIAVWIAERLAELVLWVARFAPVVEVPPPRPFELCVAAVAVLALCRSRRHRLRVVLASSLLIAASYGMSYWPRAELRVTFLDVGQGDAAVIEAPGGETWLIDAGGRLFGVPTEDASRDELEIAKAQDPGEQAVWRFLEARRIRRLDVVILSHPHPDHYGGLAALAAHLPIGEVWTAGDEPEDPAWERMSGRLAGRIRQPPLGVARERGGARLEILAPGLNGGRATADPTREVNENSLVVKLAFAGRTLLFPGDIEKEGEASLVLGAHALGVDVMKVPHHGSRTSSSPEFVLATHPETAVISCGHGNRFGFPAAEVVARWEAAGARVLRTDRDGAITIAIAPDGALDVTSFRRDTL